MLMQTYHYWGPYAETVKLKIKIETFLAMNVFKKMTHVNFGNFAQGPMS